MWIVAFCTDVYSELHNTIYQCRVHVILYHSLLHHKGVRDLWLHHIGDILEVVFAIFLLDFFQRRFLMILSLTKTQLTGPMKSLTGTIRISN